MHDPIARIASLEMVSSGAVAADHARASPFVQFGSSVEEVCDQLVDLRDRHGVSYVTVFDGRSEGFDDVVVRLSGS
ncbi:MAG: hypothetical protein HY241_15145 [Actinobacteria bacterium]|nr:hypothetical protein [Actinomycetota bacterium]